MLIFLMVSNMWNEIQLQREARCQQIIHFHQKGGKKGRAKVQKNRVQHSKQKTQYSALTQTRYRIQEHHYLKITYHFDLSIFTQVTTKIFTTSLLIPLLRTIQFHTHAFIHMSAPCHSPQWVRNAACMEIPNFHTRER